jgi:hypothetical protein
MTKRELERDFRSQTSSVFSRFRTPDPVHIEYVGYSRIRQSVRVSGTVIRLRRERRKTGMVTA